MQLFRFFVWKTATSKNCYYRRYPFIPLLNDNQYAKVPTRNWKSGTFLGCVWLREDGWERGIVWRTKGSGTRLLKPRLWAVYYMLLSRGLRSSVAAEDNGSRGTPASCRSLCGTTGLYRHAITVPPRSRRNVTSLVYIEWCVLIENWLCVSLSKFHNNDQFL